MSSGSFKDLTKTLSASLPTVSTPLPDDLLEVLHAYLEKHATYDESDAQRLQDELLSLYESQIHDRPPRLAPFLAILRMLKQAIRGSGRLLQWWDKLALPVLNNIGEEKGLALEAKNTLLGILVYDEDDEVVKKDAIHTSEAVSQNLLEVWLKKHQLGDAEFDNEARFVEGQIQLILLAFGRKRPKDLLNTVNKFFVKKDCRILTLSLLCEFIRQQPPHLHQMLQTPLFDNLLKCLQIDTSTRVISLAMTALIMFLPHIPSSSADHLPALFNIYSRMLFWDRERRANTETAVVDGDDEKSERSESLPEDDTAWAKLSYLLESDDETVPELLHYFTFLYGLYPINFMSYIRKPQRYLRHANFQGADDLDIQPTEIRQRSEPFRQVHLLHPNFYEMTIESELTDNNRWMRSEAADVVAECMALYSPGDETHAYATRSRSNASKRVDMNIDVPEQPLLEQEIATPFQSRHTSWRNTSSTIVASPDGCRHSGLHRKASQTSQSMPSIADSPSIRPVDRTDSPTLPPHMISSTGHPQLQDMLNSQRSTRGSLYQALTNDSVASLALSQNHQDSSVHVDVYLQSLTQEPAPRSPSLRPTHNDPGLKVAYLHREIQLLRNDINFERYLKQQHLSHIGQLRRKQIREARVEAETQNLLNSNRGLKSKLEEAKRLNAQMKKEGEKSKSHSRKWEVDLSTKLRALRDEQKKWALEKEELNREIGRLRDDAVQLRQLVVGSEAKELASQQKMQSIESSLDELERLRAEVEKLTLSLRTYEAGETLAVQAREREENALKEVEVLTLRLQARDEELNKHKAAFAAELQSLRSQSENGINGNDRKHNQDLTQDMLDSALAVSRSRILEIQKAHNHLLTRYNALNSAYLDLKEAHDQGADENDDSILGGGSTRPFLKGSQTFRAQSPTPIIGSDVRRRNHTFSETEFDSHPTSPGPSDFPVHPARLDTSFTPTGPDSRSPIGGNGGLFHSPFKSSAGNGVGRVSVSSEGASLDGYGNVKPKIQPQSDIRIYGRGGVQNIGKKEKDKKDKGKEKDKDKDSKDKKSPGIRGLRGFV